MYATLFYFVGVLSLIYTLTDAASKAPFIRKCYAEDSKCIKESAMAVVPKFCDGIPELNVEPSDPLFLKEINSSAPNLNFILKDVKVTGLKNSIINGIELDLLKSKLYMKVEYTIDLNGKYDVDGRILLVVIKGKGNAHIKIRKAHFDYVCEFNEKTGKDGLIYINLLNIKFTYKLMDKAEIELDNLFDGNEVLGRAARELFRSSANDIVQEIGQPAISSVLDKTAGNIKKLFRAVPLNDLVLM